MAYHKDRIGQVVSTGGTGNLVIGAAVTKHRAFVVGDDARLFPYVIEDGDAWETGYGTYTHSGTIFARTTRNDSSTGAALNVTTAAKVYVTWIADLAARALFNEVSGTDADTAMAVNTMYVVDMSAWATADRTYTLPATAAVGDCVGILIQAGDASHELLITATSGDTLNGIAGGTEWSRLFITGEVVVMRCIVANTTWIVEHDGRIPQHGQMHLSTAASAESADTWTQPTAKSGVWTATFDIGNVCSPSNDRLAPRRAGKYVITIAGHAGVTNTVADIAWLVSAWKNGTTNLIFNAAFYLPVTGKYAQAMGLATVSFVANDYALYRWFSGEASRGLLAMTLPDIRNSFAIFEILS